MASGFHSADSLSFPFLHPLNGNQSLLSNCLASIRSTNLMDMYPTMGSLRKSRSSTILTVITALSLSVQRNSYGASQTGLLLCLIRFVWKLDEAEWLR